MVQEVGQQYRQKTLKRQNRFNKQKMRLKLLLSLYKLKDGKSYYYRLKISSENIEQKMARDNHSHRT